MGGLPSEIVENTYDELGDLTAVGGATGYLRDVDYSALAQPQLLTLGTGGTGNKNLYVAETYEEGTGPLTRSSVTDQTHPYMLQDLNYSHDQAGNVTAISDPTTLGGTSSADTQCFAYDGHQRLTEAWTPATQKCDTAPDAGSLSGPAPYWDSYTYTQSGQRQSETVHKTAGVTKTTYCYTGAQPHTLTGTTTTTDCTKPEKTYSYDKTGNTTSRPGATATQALAWSDEGKLAKITENGKATDYLYGADGNLLIRTTQDGERVLYAGAAELHLKADGATWAQRYYSAGSTPIAVRTNQSGTEKLRYLTGDNHNTSSLAITSDNTQATTKRHMDPFGAERGKPTGQAWPDDKGFLGKTNDSTTGLTHIGAREYDPTTGQFISVDPLLDTGAAQSLNGYGYAENNPVTLTDPTGLGVCMPEAGCGGVDSVQDEVKKIKKANPGDYDGIDNGGTAHSGSGGGGGGGGGGVWGWLGTVGHTIVDQAKNTVISVAKTPYRQFIADWQCISGGDNCGDALEYLLLAQEPGVGIVQGLTQRVQEIYGDYSHGRSAQGTGKLVFDIALILATRGEGTEVEAAEEGALTATKGAKTGGCSFTPATSVLMAHGGTKPIGKIKTGDKVEAADPATGKHQRPHTVTATHVNHDYDLIDLRIRRTNGTTATLHTNAKHPFWDDTLHTWIPAGQLHPGHALNTPNNRHAYVAAVTVRPGDGDMYNLTVDTLHTYYVLAGATPVLVHNCNGRDPVNGGLDDDTYDRIDGAHGPDVADGVDYQVQRMHDGSSTAADHDLPGIGHDPDALASYFASWRGKMTHTDTRTGSRVAYDSSRGVLLVTTGRNIHGFRYSQGAFESGRYVTP
ncbi:polymorphic toxin-type HINT domain-containing protein [Streptomyces sp. NPDC051322]|uniref:polymorphic toxin-type HINT domain-containing protein n=1 Tax=Streptomyces sp. NPDC051322 TaxID=3154645 RepID=UPI00344C53D0